MRDLFSELPMRQFQRTPDAIWQTGHSSKVKSETQDRSAGRNPHGISWFISPHSYFNVRPQSHFGFGSTQATFTDYAALRGTISSRLTLRLATSSS